MLKRKSARRAVTASSGLLLIAASIGMVLAVGSASASVPQPTGAIPAASGKMTKVIVLLRDRAAGLAAKSPARAGAVHTEVAPIARALRAHGARHVTTGTTLPFVVASVSSAQEKALESKPSVQAVFPDAVIPAPKSALTATDKLVAPLTHGSSKRVSAPCGTASAPEQDPEALGVIKGPAALNAGFDGAGITVGYIAGTIDTTIADFQRNAKYASSGSPAGSPVVTNVNFEGDPANTPDPSDASTESFGDAGSIAAQGNTVYDLSKFVNTSHPLPSPCDITVTGSAPGANVLGLDVFSKTNLTTESNFIQAIQYAVAHGVKVLNESFGSNPFPDTALDATRIADDQAVAAGVTVVVSSGDAGITSTIGSPSTDPKLISVGGSTTFRAYQQDTFGGINATSPNATNGKWVDNNISTLSSGGFAQNGKTVDLVAPGDLNWSVCSPNQAIYEACADDNGNPTGLQLFGGTSESAPLTSGAAADVIQAYFKTHGKYPSPALVKRILTSTATDIGSPAEQQGAGLLNIGAAVKLAESVGLKHGKGGLFISPGQIDITQSTGHTAKKRIKITNDGSKKMTVHLSTRTLTKRVASHTGSFCLDPGSQAISCGGPTTHSFQIWSGFTEVYQEETFAVPSTGKKVSRLNFSFTYPFTGQTSLLHVALYDPSGRYAGYSLPQGLANYGNIQVAKPRAGKWTAVFFTVQNDTFGDIGTSGNIHYEADTWVYGRAGSIKPASLSIKPGHSKTAVLKVKSPKTPGDIAESVLIKSKAGKNTIPVTVRTLVKTGASGGTFNGVLTGGNGRGNPAVMHTYAFNVPSGQKDIDVSVSFANGDDDLVGFLQDPNGNTVASSSNITLDNTGACCLPGQALNVYKDHPQAGRWTFVLDWLPPVAGDSFSQLSMKFKGKVQFNQASASSNLPNGATLSGGQAHAFNVTVKNTGASPQLFFLDPRASGTATYQLPDLTGSDQSMTLPLPQPSQSNPIPFPLYVVPTDTSAVQTSISGSGPVTYDFQPWTGDPDLSPAMSAPTSGNSASFTYTPSGGEAAPGLWQLVPSEIGPYGASGASSETASANFSVKTQSFDSTVSPSTGDLWSAYAGLTPFGSFSPVFLNPGQSKTLKVTITPSASAGTTVSGTINVDDVFQANFLDPGFELGGDELASLPYSYTVG
jgi:hypothetical protein